MNKTERAVKKLREKKILDGIGAAKSIGKEILFPTVRRFEELFDNVKVVEDLGSYKSRDVKTWVVDELLPHGKVGKGQGRAHINSFCAVQDQKHRHLDVEPKLGVVKMVEERMLLCDQYEINFEVTDRGNGTALVTAQYNLISGNRWFAIIDSDTIPGRT